VARSLRLRRALTGSTAGWCPLSHAVHIGDPRCRSLLAHSLLPIFASTCSSPRRTIFRNLPALDELYDRIGRIWLAMAIPMMVLVCLRWLAILLGSIWAYPPKNIRCRRRHPRNRRSL
jgi:hypothetical protein